MFDLPCNHICLLDCFIYSNIQVLQHNFLLHAPFFSPDPVIFIVFLFPFFATSPVLPFWVHHLSTDTSERVDDIGGICQTLLLLVFSEFLLHVHLEVVHMLGAKLV